MNYTKSSRSDGCWDVDQECHDEDVPDYGPVEIFKLRRDGPGKGTQRPICVIEDPDMTLHDPKSECGGNIALIVTAPVVYESLKRTAEMLRFIVDEQPAKIGVSLYKEILCCMGDAEQTLRLVERTYEALMAGEHVS